jgi:competence protein ComEC
MAALPAMPDGAYAAMIAGGLWIALWRTPVRWAGAVPLAFGAGWALLTPAPDLLVTGDGRHLAVRTAGGMALLRERAGDYTRSMLGENSGTDDAALADLAEQPGVRCSEDLCLVDVTRGGRRWRIAATRSAYLVPWQAMIAACRSADVVVSERRLPPGCMPRWLKLDRPTLAETGGVAITLGSRTVRTVRGDGHHPWLNPPRVQPPFAQRPTAARRETSQTPRL